MDDCHVPALVLQSELPFEGVQGLLYSKEYPYIESGLAHRKHPVEATDLKHLTDRVAAI